MRVRKPGGRILGRPLLGEPVYKEKGARLAEDGGQKEEKREEKVVAQRPKRRKKQTVRSGKTRWRQGSCPG